MNTLAISFMLLSGDSGSPVETEVVYDFWKMTSKQAEALHGKRAVFKLDTGNACLSIIRLDRTNKGDVFWIVRLPLEPIDATVAEATLTVTRSPGRTEFKLDRVVKKR